MTKRDLYGLPIPSCTQAMKYQPEEHKVAAEQINSSLVYRPATSGVFTTEELKFGSILGPFQGKSMSKYRLIKKGK